MSYSPECDFNSMAMGVEFKNKKYIVLLQESEMSAVSHLTNLILALLFHSYM